MILLFSVLLLVFAAGIVLLATGKAKYCGRMLLTLVVAAAALGAAYVGLFAVSLSTRRPAFYIPAYLVLVPLVAAALLCLIWCVLRKKGVWVTLGCITSVWMVVFGGVYGYDRYVESIPTLSDSQSMLWEYDPYGPATKVALLDAPSDLQLAGRLPKLDGATALYPVYAAFARATYPAEILQEKRLTYVACSSTPHAYERIVSGEADMIFVAAPSAQQRQAAQEAGVELVFTPIGKEAFVFFVNAQNPVDSLTVEQVQQIYTGELTDWGQLGAGLGSIRAFQRDEGSGSQSALLRLMEGKPLMQPPVENVIQGMGGIIRRTADYKNYKNAIGFTFRFYATEMVQNQQIKLLQLNGIPPTAQTIADGTYPIVSEFYAVTRADADENTRLLLEWVLSGQGQQLVKETGYVPIAPQTVQIDD